MAADKLRTKVTNPVVMDVKPINVTLIAVQGCNSTRGTELFGCGNNSIIDLVSAEGFSNDVRQIQVQVLPTVDGRRRERAASPSQRHGWYPRRLQDCRHREQVNVNGRFTRFETKVNPTKATYWSQLDVHHLFSRPSQVVTGCSQHDTRHARQSQLCRAGDIVTITRHRLLASGGVQLHRGFDRPSPTRSAVSAAPSSAPATDGTSDPVPSSPTRATSHYGWYSFYVAHPAQ
ncbi:MAG: hypothetical protein U5N53_00440 [Mycobacterium sp.]|nr:hypothetical protein [Mycobacterium sp.]